MVETIIKKEKAQGCAKTTENKLLAHVIELLEILETVEESSNGILFHPTTLRSCRVQHTMQLDKIMHVFQEARNSCT